VAVWREEFLDSFLLFGLLVFFIVVPWVHHQYRRYGRWRGWPAVVSAATFLYACSLIAFTTFPFPDLSDPDLCTGAGLRSYWQTTPFASIDDVFAYSSSHGLLDTLTSGVFLQVLFNVFFFVPLGFLLAYRWRRGVLSALGISFAVSLLIEATQGTGLWGLMPCPYRLADVDDLLTNTLGGLLGWLLGRWLMRYLPSPRPEKESDLDPPTRRRIALAHAMDIYTFAFVFVVAALLLSWAGLDLASATTSLTITSLTVSFVLFVLVPGFRKDRAGPGIAAANLVLVATKTGGPAGWWALLIRWALWWLPLAVLGIPVFMGIALVDGIVALARRDRRGLRSVIAGTSFITRSQWLSS
jgi:glycopeptide antibiotics resistance protein